jgi:hypothetical protein
MARDPSTKAMWKPEAPALGWMIPFGTLFVLVGMLGFLGVHRRFCSSGGWT